MYILIQIDHQETLVCGEKFANNDEIRMVEEELSVQLYSFN